MSTLDCPCAPLQSMPASGASRTHRNSTDSSESVLAPQIVTTHMPPKKQRSEKQLAALDRDRKAIAAARQALVDASPAGAAVSAGDAADVPMLEGATGARNRDSNACLTHAHGQRARDPLRPRERRLGSVGAHGAHGRGARPQRSGSRVRCHVYNLSSLTALLSVSRSASEVRRCSL